MKKLILVGLSALIILSCMDSNWSTFLLIDDFDELTSGDMFNDVGAHTEYHYLKQTAPIGNWALTSFRNETQNSWSVQRDGDDKIIYQKKYYPPGMDYYPMLVAGDVLWEDYEVEARFAPMEKRRQSGVVVRYKNDRCYYFVGVERDSAVLKLVQHGTGFFVLNEKVLVSQPMPYEDG